MRLMRFSPKIHQIRSINKFFLSILKSPTQIGFAGVINLEPNISCLGPFKHSETFSGYLVRMLKVSIVYSRRACNRSCVLCPALPPSLPPHSYSYFRSHSAAISQAGRRSFLWAKRSVPGQHISWNKSAKLGIFASRC
jgi:hypothetical protein